MVDTIHVTFTHAEDVYRHRWPLACVRCGKGAPLIANHCAECEPELHRKWNEARATVNDADEATPEMVSAFVELERVKQKGKEQQPRVEGIELLPDFTAVITLSNGAILPVAYSFMQNGDVMLEYDPETPVDIALQSMI